MKVTYGEGQTEFGPGVSIDLTGDEVAQAIDTYLVAHGVHVRGPRTVTVNDALCEAGQVYVDPSGFVVHEGERLNGWLLNRCTPDNWIDNPPERKL